MADSGSVWTALSTAGIGTAVGYITSAAIAARATRKTRADDASALVGAATELTDRLLTANHDLAHINAQLRHALHNLVLAVQRAQDMFEHFPELGDGASNREMMVILHAALDAANAIDF